jgi:hypothetical protein
MNISSDASNQSDEQTPVANTSTGLLIAAVTLLILLPLLMLWRVVLNGDILLTVDMLLAYEPWHSEIPGAPAFPLWNEKSADLLRIMYPINLFIKAAWQRGEIPFWYPLAGVGIPVLAEGIHQALYPLNLIGWQLLGLPEGLGWLAIFHLFLGEIFTFLFLRQLGVGYFGSLVAAITFSFSSVLMTWLGLPFFRDTMVWLPLIFLGLEYALNKKNWRWALIGAFGLGLQVLAGSLQLVMYGLTSLALYALGRSGLVWWQSREFRQAIRPVGYATLIIGLGLGLAAFQILPTIELVSQGMVRGEAEFNPYLPWRSLARLLIPDLIGTPVDGNDMSTLEFEAYLYIGLLPLFFVVASLFSKQALLARLFFGLGLLFMLVIYGIPPFYQFFYYLYPTFTSLGLHRSLYIVVFMWAVAAGIGADWILDPSSKKVVRYLFGAGLIVGAFVLVYMLPLVFLTKYQARFFWHLPSVPEVEPSLLYHISTYMIFLLFFIAVLGLLGLWSASKLSKPVFIGGALLLLIGDLFLTHLDLTPVLPKYLYQVTPPSLTYLQTLIAQETEPVRVSNVRNVLRSNIAGIYNIPSIRAHDVFLTTRFNDYTTITGLRIGGSSFREITFRAATGPLFNALNVKYIYANRDDLLNGDWFSILNLGQPMVVSDHSEAGQVKYWNINNWTQPVLFAPTNSRLSYQGVLPYQAVLETAIAVDPQVPPQGDITFEIYATKPGQEASSPIFSYRLEPRGKDSEVKWRPVVVSLAEFANLPVLLSLVTTSDNGQVISGGWADPLLMDGSKYEQIYYGVNGIYKNKQYLPRAWVVHQVIQVSTIDEVKQRLTDPEFNPATEAVIEGRLLEEVSPSDSVEKAQVIQYAPSHIKISVEMKTAGFLVFSDLYYPGWQVYVDAVQKPLYATNLIMRGVYMPAGAHEIEFIYDPLSFKIGWFISLATLLIILVSLALDWKFKRNNSI